jgi:general stress protein YciG
MPSRPGNDDRIAGTNSDRDRQRDVSSDNERHDAAQSGSVRTRSNRGFASMDRNKQKEIASKGGKAAHAKGTAHEFDSGEAREAGRKGGVAVSRNREHMAAIGRRGGEARGHSRANSSAQPNTGGASQSIEGNFQNSRGGIAASDRQVAIDSQNERGSSNATTGSANSNANRDRNIGTQRTADGGRQ